MNEWRNVYDEHKEIMNAVVMKHVSFELMMDMKRKISGDIQDNETYENTLLLFWLIL